MQHPGNLDHHGMVLYQQALSASGAKWWTAQLLNRARQVTSNIAYFTDGQVNIDVTAAAGRTATLTVFDFDNHIKADSNVLLLNRMLKLTYWVNVEALSQVVGCTVFCGPMTKCDDTGLGVLAMEAQGKELYLRGQIKKPRRWPKGALVTDVITDIALDAGEDRSWLDIPQMKDRLPAPGYQVGPGGKDGNWRSAWDAITYLAGSIGCDVFFNGESRMVLRPQATALVWEWTQSGALIGPSPQESLLVGGVQGAANDVAQIVNNYIVVGQGKPVKGGGKPPVVQGEAIAPANTRFAPSSLGNPGPPGLYLVEREVISAIRLNSTANRIAKNRLSRRLEAAEQVAGHSVVVPHLDEWDRCRIKTDGFARTADLQQASIPIVFSESNPMTVGFTEQVSVPAQRMRR